MTKPANQLQNYDLEMFSKMRVLAVEACSLYCYKTTTCLHLKWPEFNHPLSDTVSRDTFKQINFETLFAGLMCKCLTHPFLLFFAYSICSHRRESQLESPVQDSSQARHAYIYIYIYPTDMYTCMYPTDTHPCCGPQVLDDTFYPVHNVSSHGLLLWSWWDEIEKIHDFFMKTVGNQKVTGQRGSQTDAQEEKCLKHCGEKSWFVHKYICAHWNLKIPSTKKKYNFHI